MISLLPIVYLLLGTFQAFSQKNDAVDELRLMSAALQRIPHLHYQQKRELNYPSENYHHEATWQLFVDFKSSDTLVGMKYQVVDPTATQIFNGTEKFALDHKNQTIAINDRPDRQSLASHSAFYNSIVTIKNILPLLIGNDAYQKETRDTIVDGKDCRQVIVHLGKSRIQNLGMGLDAMTTKSNLIYTFVVNRSNHLPLAVIQQNDGNSDCIKTRFTHVDTTTVVPDERSWYYSSYTGTYRQADKAVPVSLIASGTMAPQWTLPVYRSTTSSSMNALKGRVVMLEFWIKNCGPCIESVPVLNRLQQKYAGKKLDIIGINAYDTAPDIDGFTSRHKPAYKILLQGKAVAEKYGVTAFPSVVIIDKSGQVAYAGLGLDEAALEKLINGLL